jgi:hypothetical protein
MTGKLQSESPSNKTLGHSRVRFLNLQLASAPITEIELSKVLTQPMMLIMYLRNYVLKQMYCIHRIWQQARQVVICARRIP